MTVSQMSCGPGLRKELEHLILFDVKSLHKCFPTLPDSGCCVFQSPQLQHGGLGAMVSAEMSSFAE